MNSIYITPDPPKAGKPFRVTYWWDPATPGQTVILSIAYDNGTKGMDIQLTCPEAGSSAVSGEITAPDGTATVQVTDLTGGADPVLRGFV